MPPYQQPQVNQPPAPQSPQDPYHFILNPEQPKRRPSLRKPGGWLFIVGAVAFVAVLLVIVLSLTRGGGSNSQPLIAVAQQQQEIGRVAGLDLAQVRDISVKNFATTIQLTMASDSTTLTTYLKKGGVKVSDKQLAASMNSATDTQLTSAISSNTLDVTLRTTLQTELKQYQASLTIAYQASSTQATRALLVKLNNNASLLLTQSQQ